MEGIDPEAAEHGKGETDRQTDGRTGAEVLTMGTWNYNGLKWPGYEYPPNRSHAFINKQFMNSDEAVYRGLFFFLFCGESWRGKLQNE